MRAVVFLMDDTHEFDGIIESVHHIFSEDRSVQVFAALEEKAYEVLSVFEPSQSNLVDHAKRELELVGEEEQTVRGYLRVIQAFADMGHSGGSASVAIPTINELLQFRNLTDLTDDPEEWMLVDMGDEPCWQSRRRAEAFSTDGGKTYYLLSDDVRIIRSTTHKEV